MGRGAWHVRCGVLSRDNDGRITIQIALQMVGMALQYVWLAFILCLLLGQCCCVLTLTQTLPLTLTLTLTLTQTLACGRF